MSGEPEKSRGATHKAETAAPAAARPPDIRELVELPERGMHGNWRNREIPRIRNAALHQLRVAGMSAAQRARHDLDCRWCKIQVPWKPAALELLNRLRARDGGDKPAAPRS